MTSLKNGGFIPAGLMALFLCVVPTFGQQSTTNTNCNVNGQWVSCTSNTTTFAPPPDPWANTSKQLQESGQRLGAALAANAQRRNEEKTVEFHVVYCEQNPNNSITTTNGEKISCTEEFARTRALCSIGKNNKRYKFCALLANAPAPTASSALTSAAELAPSNSAPSVPGPAPISSAPQASLTTPSPTLTAEQKDALSYCQRNPTATITWNNGTVSPCSSVLGAQ
jgi:hypothetical protein